MNENSIMSIPTHAHSNSSEASRQDASLAYLDISGKLRKTQLCRHVYIIRCTENMYLRPS